MRGFRKCVEYDIVLVIILFSYLKLYVFSEKTFLSTYQSGWYYVFLRPLFSRQQCPLQKLMSPKEWPSKDFTIADWNVSGPFSVPRTTWYGSIGAIVHLKVKKCAIRDDALTVGVLFQPYCSKYYIQGLFPFILWKASFDSSQKDSTFIWS